jgi:serine/threonine protein phosphatase 1
LLVVLGDFIDRGPHSAQMLDHFIAPPPPQVRRIALMGNHEDMFVNFLRNPHPNHPWLGFGGMETLRSYGIRAGKGGLPQGRALHQLLGAHIPQDHIDFLANLPLAVHLPHMMFAHAGANGARPARAQLRQDLLWGNAACLDTAPLPVRVVHGHTPTPDSRPHITPARVNIDTGAYASGILTALEMIGLNDLRFIVAQAGQAS